MPKWVAAPRAANCAEIAKNYLFLLFFAFFMFAISINLYVTSIQGSDTEMRYVISPLGHTYH